MKIRTENVIVVGDWDDLVTERYEEEYDKELNENLIVKYTKYVLEFKLPQNETIFLILTLLYHDSDFKDLDILHRRDLCNRLFFIDYTFKKIKTKSSRPDYEDMIDTMITSVYNYNIPYVYNDNVYFPNLNSECTHNTTVELLVEKLKNGELPSILKARYEIIIKRLKVEKRQKKLNMKSRLKTEKDRLRTKELFWELSLSKDETDFLTNSLVSKSYLDGNLFKYLLNDTFFPDPYPECELSKFSQILIKRLENGELTSLVEALNKDIVEALNTIDKCDVDSEVLYDFNIDIERSNIKAWQVYIIDSWEEEEEEKVTVQSINAKQSINVSMGVILAAVIGATLVFLKLSI